MSTVGVATQRQRGQGFHIVPSTSWDNNYITEIMSVMQGSAKWRQSAQLPESAIRASRARFPSCGVATPDLSARLVARNVKHKSGPLGRLVRLVSSLVRSQTIQVLMPVDATPNPIDDIVGYRIPWVDPVQLTAPIHADTIGTSYRFPAALSCPWISS